MSKVYVPGYGYVDSSKKKKKTWDPGRAIQGSSTSKTPPVFDPVPPATDTGTSGTTNKQSSMSAAYGIDAGDPVVSFPNMQWYYSSADVYGSQDPSDPRSSLLQGVEGAGAGGASPMWNFGMDASDADDAYDDDALVPQGLRDVLDAIAVTIHPQKKGRSLWEESVAASALASKRGEYISPYAILRRRYFDGNEPEAQGDGAGSYTSGGGGGGYGGGGGATSQRIDLASPSQAQALLTQFMQASVGRDPKPSEVRKFVELLQGYQTNNPTVVSAAGNTVTQTGGVDPGMVAQEFVETLPDYTEAQADSYYRTFMQALLGGAA